MSIRIEKILSLSAREYCESTKKKLSDYTVTGVHVNVRSHEDILTVLQRIVPDKAEVLVNYKSRSTTNFWGTVEKVAQGYALIPKKNNSK